MSQYLSSAAVVIGALRAKFIHRKARVIATLNYFHDIHMMRFCITQWPLLITFANSLDPDQDRPSVGPELDPNRLTP